MRLSRLLSLVTFAALAGACVVDAPDTYVAAAVSDEELEPPHHGEDVEPPPSPIPIVPRCWECHSPYPSPPPRPGQPRPLPNPEGTRCGACHIIPQPPPPPDPHWPRGPKPGIPAPPMPPGGGPPMCATCHPIVPGAPWPPPPSPLDAVEQPAP